MTPPSYHITSSISHGRNPKAGNAALTPATGGPAHKRAGLAIVQKGPHGLAARHARWFFVRVHQLHRGNHLRVVGYHRVPPVTRIPFDSQNARTRPRDTSNTPEFSPEFEALRTQNYSFVDRTSLARRDSLFSFPPYADSKRSQFQLAGYSDSQGVANSCFFGATRLTKRAQARRDLPPPLSSFASSFPPVLFRLPLLDRRFGPSFLRGLGAAKDADTGCFPRNYSETFE